MPERGTSDLDVAVLPAGISRAEWLLRAARYEGRGPLAIGGSASVSPEGIPVLLIEGREAWWPQALAKAANNAPPGRPPVLPLHWLVLMKMESGRSRDFGDISQMLGLAPADALGRARATFDIHAPDMREDLESMITAGKLEYDAPGRTAL